MTAFLFLMLLATPAVASPAPLPASASGDTVRALPQTSKEIWVDLAARPTSGRGSVARLLFSVINMEDTPERLRLAVVTTAGWRILDDGLMGREQMLESGDEIEGEFHLVIPRDARVGSIHVVRLIVEVLGDAGVAESTVPIRVDASRGLAPNRAGIAGTVQGYRHGMDLDQGSIGTIAGSLDASGPLARGWTFSGSVQRGHRLNQPPILSSYTASADRYSAELRSRDWILSGGNMVSVVGSEVLGPFVRVQGGSLRRHQGRLTGDVTFGAPVSWDGTAGGRLARGRAALRLGPARLGVSGSGLERSGTLSMPGHEVVGAGVDGEIRAGSHRFEARGGHLAMRNDTGVVSEGIPLDLGWSMNRPWLSANVRRRWMPPSVPGVYNAPSGLSADASLRLIGPLRLLARAYQSESEVLGEPGWRGSGLSGGVLFLSSAGHRVEVRANHREYEATQRTVRRTGQLSLGMPAGPLRVDAYLEHGRQDRADRSDETLVLRSNLRHSSARGTVAASVMYSDLGIAEPRIRGDLWASLRLPVFELDGGAWASQGLSYGGTPGVWANVVFPPLGGFNLIAGGEYVKGRVPYTRFVDPVTGDPLPPEIADDPLRAPFVGVPVAVPAGPVRVTLGARRALTIPLPWRIAPASIIE